MKGMGVGWFVTVAVEAHILITVENDMFKPQSMKILCTSIHMKSIHHNLDLK